MNWNGIEIFTSALAITSGAELERFALGSVEIRGMKYIVLTGYEGEGNICWWCGKEIIQGKRKAHYCRGRSRDDFTSCFRKYHQYFDWAYASSWAKKRAVNKCENCGCAEQTIGGRTNLEVHHIVPLKGEARFFSTFNLPWNLIVFCHDCHMEVHSIMRNGHTKSPQDIFELALSKGQSVMRL